MLNLLVLYFIREKRSVFISKMTFPLRIFSSIINILFYYYAAKAFNPNPEIFPMGNRWSLFQYVMIGELTLAFHLDSILIYSQQLRQIISEGVFDTLLLTQSGLLKPLIHQSIVSLSFGLLTFIFNILFLYLCFDFPIKGYHILEALWLNLNFLPLFSSFGILSAAFLIIFRRGTSLLGTFTGVLGILSGAYFPIQVFPELITKLNSKVNPLYILLNETRNILAENHITNSFIPLSFLVFGVALLFISIQFFNYAIKIYKKRGGVLILGT